MRRLLPGPLLSLMLSDWLAVTNGSSGNMRMKIFSGHDGNVRNILLSLNVYGGLPSTPPPFASSVVFELHQDEDEESRYR